MSRSADGRVNPVFKAMNRPLTVLGAERRLFFVALISGGAIFSLFHSLFGGIGLFIVGTIIARIATKHDVEILRVLFNSSKFRRRYDPMKAGLHRHHDQEQPMFRIEPHHEGLEGGRIVCRADQPVRVLGRALVSDEIRRPRRGAQDRRHRLREPRPRRAGLRSQASGSSLPLAR